MTWQVGCGLDIGLRSDATGGCVVLASDAKKPVFYVATVFERRPTRGAPLVPSVVVSEFCTEAKRYGGQGIAVDQFYIESVREHVRAAGMHLHEAPSGNAGKVELYTRARELIHSRRVLFAAGQKRLVQQLREVMSSPLPGGGVRITSPRRRGAHGDLVSAFILALWRAERREVVGAYSSQREHVRRVNNALRTPNFTAIDDGQFHWVAPRDRGRGNGVIG